MNKVFFSGFGVGFILATGAGLIVAYIWKKKVKKIIDAEVEQAVKKVLDQLETEKKNKEATESKAANRREPKGAVVAGVIGAVAPSGSGVSYREIVSSYSGAYLDSDPVLYEHPSEEAFSETEEEADVEDYEKYEQMVKSNEIVTDENRSYIEGEEADSEMHSGKRPKLITWESWINERPEFDKIQLAYYTGENGDDGCLVDVEADEEIFDEDKIIGDCLDKFDFRHNDEDVIYVRNFSFGADYEIAKYIGRWRWKAIEV